MTETNSIFTLNSLLKEAGYTDASSRLNIAESLPNETSVMSNSYSIAFIYQLSLEKCLSSSPLIKVKEEMHSFIRNVLSDLEVNKGIIVDGYLLIAFDQEPTEKIKEEVRKIETDTKICRKHIVWPTKNKNTLERIQFVTILSLPRPLQSSITATAPFELSAEANAFLTKYGEVKNLERLIDSIKNGDFTHVD